MNLAKSATVGIAVQLGELERLTLEGDGDTLFVLSEDTVRDLDRTVALALAAVQRGDAAVALASSRTCRLARQSITRTQRQFGHWRRRRSVKAIRLGPRSSSMTFRARPISTASWPRWRPVWPRPESGIEPKRCTGWVWPVDTADGTGDVVAQAITRLAEATGQSSLGESTAAEARAEAQVRLDELGLQARGWITAFDQAVGANATHVGV